LPLLVVGCGADDDEPAWAVVQEELPGALMSVWAPAPDDVWVVGADAGEGPEVLRFDGASWHRLTTGSTGDLWWVFGFESGPVFLGGEGGVILRYADGAFQPMATPGVGTVFGIWGASPTDVWAVGGSEGGAGGAFAWRLQGETWVAADGFPAELATDHAVWKVFGRSSREVWLVGTLGLILEWNGSQFSEHDAGTTASLFTIHGNADRLAAVGGFANGVLVEYDGAQWTNATPAQSVPLIGVCLAPDGEDGYATGTDGAVYRRSGGTWALEPTNVGAYLPLHAVTLDPRGGVWAVGGQVLSQPLVRGILLHKGAEISGGLP
jgi:hypothetical protein